jgi:ubiquinone/menaquinone biosynthesis C-methylase UbiE
MTIDAPNDLYAWEGDSRAQQTYLQVRRAAQWVGFFLPHLQPGFSVLDCGCGQGSITLDLAELVAPGTVVGVDMDVSQLEIARQAATERGITNVSFQQGNVYALPFADATFDAVLAHTLLVHLSDRLGALKQLRRVLKSGGMVGISDDDYHTVTYAPAEPAISQLDALVTKLIRFSGGDPFYSPQLRGLLVQAGFVNVEGHAVAAEYFGTLAETRRYAHIMRLLFGNPQVAQIMFEQGWTTPTEIQAMLDKVQDWSERPDAFYACMYCAALGWVM